MPKLTPAAALPRTPTVEFLFNPSIDLMNAMYFTRLVVDTDGVEGWPVEVRAEMEPGLLAELDFLYTFPNDQPGVMGQLGDVLFAHPEAWESIEALVAWVRNLPLGIGESEADPGVQGLAFHLCCTVDEPEPPLHDDPREALRLKIQRDGATDIDAKLRLWDRPEELRERMARLIERFYEEHYKAELPKRRGALERSVAAHRGATLEQALDLMRKVTGRPASCLENGICPGPYERTIFSPSLDVGPYSSCISFEGRHSVHGMIYALEAEFLGDSAADSSDTQRLARIYKALGDEQRLRILGMLRDTEMYAQEIVERLDLHQSVVSRHLMLLKAVGLVDVRKQNNMKFFSLNSDITSELGKTLDLFAGVRKEA